MSIRLNKVIRELNVGIDTIVDYLKETGVEIKSNPNEKITEEQYEALRTKFGADKTLRKEADKLLMEQKDRKDAWEHYMAYTRQGGCRVFTELLKNAGLESPFEESCLNGVCRTASEWLKGYDMTGIE